MQNGLQHGDTMTEKRFENRLDKSNVKFNTLNPTWDNEKETGLNVFEMIDELNKLSDENEQLKEELMNANELNGIYVDFLVDKGFELSDVVEWSKELKKNTINE